jgi:hypothetical protein
MQMAYRCRSGSPLGVGMTAFPAWARLLGADAQHASAASRPSMPPYWCPSLPIPLPVLRQLPSPPGPPNPTPPATPLLGGRLLMAEFIDGDNKEDDDMSLTVGMNLGAIV